MDNSILKIYENLGVNNVSRETCVYLENFIELVLKENKVLNLISRENENKNYIRKRHIVDSMQIIDFIDFNQKRITDLGSGSGFPAIILAILTKFKNSRSKIYLYEKSYKKCQFLKKTSKILKLNTEIIQKNIHDEKDNNEMIITSRAFKPLPIVLDIVDKNFKNYTNLILFMGKSGKKILKETLNKWNLSYQMKESITNKDSFILNIISAKKI